ncbi:LysR family transcriptional regulator [Sulfitobacter aestuariivivens]|uniref:LysR family transcriptional regulator n=1 Tax=Sulfitobacter aestuariivivens TaxID=2766981 RepID=A0A927D9Q4_9RHOB|nr:LysR substrate-binding domain-containing protein [Sulfitobacter aestuariivivens]MBD3665772.1 LysR family transcriptional regulator [Sulfitobacter aestuariivivens]
MADINWSRIPSLTTLRAFEATARLEGYSAAARALNVTPAAIAQQVRKLEVDIGTPLVRKEGRGLALTDAGRRLSEPLHAAFTLIADGIDDLHRAEASRGVRVSTTDYFASSVILPRLGAFWKQHPTVQVSFSPDGNTAPVDLENFDVVIRGDAPGHQWAQHQQITLVETPMVISAAPALVGNGKVDLATMPWISDRGIGGGAFEQAVRMVGCDPDAITLVDPGSGKMELEALLMGYGLHFGPELIIRDRLADGSLVKVEAALDMRGAYYAIYANGPVPGQVRLFLDWLKATCAPLSSD